jgi:hypothetical protein
VTLRHKYVDSFNEGVRTGDWAGLLALLHDDAELEFVGIPVGPFHGRQAIAAAYAAQPPDDEIVLLDGDAYAWAREPATRAGEIRLEERDGAIARICVRYER